MILLIQLIPASFFLTPSFVHILEQKGRISCSQQLDFRFANLHECTDSQRMFLPCARLAKMLDPGDYVNTTMQPSLHAN